MGLIRRLFGGRSPEKDMYRLLSGPATEMANEMERIYRNQISIFKEDYGAVDLSASGILKARLFGVSFMLFAFGTKWQDSNLDDMMQTSSGLAMTPFYSPSYHPKMDRDLAASFAGDFMSEVVKAISSEWKEGPSTPVNLTPGFNKLISLYEDALKESIDKETYDDVIHNRVFPIIARAVNANLQHMSEWIKIL